MPESMKAIVWDGADYPRSLVYRDFAVPRPGPGWALVRTRAVGICGTDNHLVLGDTRYLVPDKNLPAVLGHENAGVVIETGEGVTRLRAGDRVAVEPILSCMNFGGSCPMCRIGQYHLCRSGLSHVGVPLTRMLPGGFGEYSIVPENRLFPIPDRLSYEEAALLDVLAVNVHALHVGRPGPGKTAAVLGCGIVGLDMVQCLRAVGAGAIIAVAKYEFQAVLAKRLGATETVLIRDDEDPAAEVIKLTAGWGVDEVYECVGGNTDAVDQSVRMCGPRGSVIMLGGSALPRPIDLQGMLLKEANILSSNSYSTYGHRREAEIALELLLAGSVDHASLVTHRFAPEDFRMAFEVSSHKGKYQAIKPMFIRD